MPRPDFQKKNRDTNGRTDIKFKFINQPKISLQIKAKVILTKRYYSDKHFFSKKIQYTRFKVSNDSFKANVRVFVKFLNSHLYKCLKKKTP